MVLHLPEVRSVIAPPQSPQKSEVFVRWALALSWDLQLFEQPNRWNAPFKASFVVGSSSGFMAWVEACTHRCNRHAFLFHLRQDIYVHGGSDTCAIKVRMNAI